MSHTHIIFSSFLRFFFEIHWTWADWCHLKEKQNTVPKCAFEKQTKIIVKFPLHIQNEQNHWHLIDFHWEQFRLFFSYHLYASIFEITNDLHHCLVIFSHWSQLFSNVLQQYVEQVIARIVLSKKKKKSNLMRFYPWTLS